MTTQNDDQQDTDAATPVRVPRTSKPLEFVAITALVVVVAFALLWAFALVLGLLRAVL